MSAKKGLTLGKFLPLHRGHELLLTVAGAHCDVLTVLVGTTPDDAYSFALREAWIREIVEAQNTCGEVRILEDPDPNPHVAKNEQGTVTDESYWTAWLGQNAASLRDTDLIFTSDVYGAEIARRTGASWFPVDPERSVVAVSGSMILAAPMKHFGYVSDAAKPDVGLTVAVLGAESTGKSTLIKALSQHFNSPYAPEWGRTISEVKPQLDAADFDAIVDVQARFIRAAQISSNGLCFTDTEAITTALFAPIYLGHEHALARRVAAEQRFDLYLVLAPTVAWVDDGTRVLDHRAREQFHAAIVDALDTLGYPYQLIDANDFPARTQAAVAAVEKLLAV